MGQVTAEVTADFTVNGGTDGLVTVADNSLFPRTAKVFLRSSTVAAAQYEITARVGTTGIRVRLVSSGPHFTAGTDVSAYTTANSATITIPVQEISISVFSGTWTNPTLTFDDYGNLIAITNGT